MTSKTLALQAFRIPFMKMPTTGPDMQHSILSYAFLLCLLKKLIKNPCYLNLHNNKPKANREFLKTQLLLPHHKSLHIRMRWSGKDYDFS